MRSPRRATASRFVSSATGPSAMPCTRASRRTESPAASRSPVPARTRRFPRSTRRPMWSSCPPSSTHQAIVTAFPTWCSRPWRADDRSLARTSAQSVLRSNMAVRACWFPRVCPARSRSHWKRLRRMSPFEGRLVVGPASRPKPAMTSTHASIASPVCWRRLMPDSTGSIAYVLKSFPRLSETFIASEIYRLERRGGPLRLFIIKRSDEPFAHPIVDAIGAPRVHLPDAAPTSSRALFQWLACHAARFVRPLARQLRRHPIRTAHAAFTAFGHAVRARKGRWALPRKSTLKEFLQAAALADALAAAGDVRHIHAHFCHSATTVAWLAAMMAGLPLSFTAHAKDVYCEELNPAGLLVRKLAAARFVVTCTDA